MSDNKPGEATHLDESGAPCTRHVLGSLGGLLQLALIGSRSSAFHHDCASKLQGILMALEELTELTANGDPDVQRALESASEASRELNALLSTSRALTKAPVKSQILLGDLLSRAASRATVSLRGDLPDETVEVAIPAVTQALSLAIDTAAGGGRGRAISVAGAVHDDQVELVFPLSDTQPTTAADALALAGFAIQRDGGRLWCTASGDRLVIRLPIVR